MGRGTGHRRDVEEKIARALQEGRFADATTCALKVYGGEIRRYLTRVLRDDEAAAEAFARFAERLWRGIAGFRRKSSFRTWAYQVARRCACDVHNDESRMLQRLETEEQLLLPQQSVTLWDRPSIARRFNNMRAYLRSQDRELLALRIDRNLPWRSVARALASPGRPLPSEAALRQRFAAVKSKLRRAARALP